MIYLNKQKNYEIIFCLIQIVSSFMAKMLSNMAVKLYGKLKGSKKIGSYLDRSPTFNREKVKYNKTNFMMKQIVFCMISFLYQVYPKYIFKKMLSEFLSIVMIVTLKKEDSFSNKTLKGR